MPLIIPLRCTIGQAAIGSGSYFDRPYLTNKIRRSINSGSNILISAPRRIGKSSILKHFANQATEGEVIKYLSVQSASNSNDFFQALFKLLIKDPDILQGIDSYTKRSSATVKGIISRFRGLSLEGLQIAKDENIHYYTECLSLINDFKGKKIVVLLDEFPDAVNNIIRADKELAIHFLLEVRELRQASSQLGLQFIFTGSSGLANVVSQLGKNDLINDLDEIEIPPYSEVEAFTFIQCLVLGYKEYDSGFQINDQVITHILKRITWRLPYYLQIIVKALFERFEETQEEATSSTVDQLLSNMIKARSQYYGFFENWLLRLERSFDKSTRLLSIEILSQLALEQATSFEKINSITLSDEPTLPIKKILNTLVHDGYISENQQQYGFNSFLLQQWWLENVAI